MSQANEKPTSDSAPDTVELTPRQLISRQLTVLHQPQFLRSLFALLMAGGLICFLIAFSNMARFLRTGFTGAFCLTCDYAAGAYKLEVVPGSPADRAGVRPGDVLVAIDGKPPSRFPIPGNDYEISGTGGTPGTSVTLTVKHRDGSTREVKIRRELGWNDQLVFGFSLIGIPGDVSVNIGLGLDIAIFTFAVLIAVFIVWRRPSDWVAMLSALAILTIGIYATRARSFADQPPVMIYEHILLGLTLALLFVFPSGKPIPSLAAYIVVLYVVWLLNWSFVLKLSPELRTATRLIDLPFWATAVGSQIYRYRRVATPEQRQQTKWALYGLVFMITEGFLFILLLTVFPALDISRSSEPLAFLYPSFGDIISRAAYLVFPLTLLAAVLRYRLWDIDYVINRSLIYGVLTVLLVMVFGGVLWATHEISLAIMGGQQPPVVTVAAATMVMAAVFQPMRTRLRELVDKQLYGIALDYKNATKRYQEVRVAASKTTRGDRKQFGKYSDLKFLGMGGMGDVYQTVHPVLERKIALKILPEFLAASPSTLKRFTREAQMLVDMQHTNLAKAYDFGQAENTYYITMEFIDGETLANYMRRKGKIPLVGALLILKGVASALDYIHERGVVHRDLKPSNIMVETRKDTKGTQTIRAVLMDFGIARAMDQSTRLTMTGDVIGTFDYIAPEQIQASSNVDGRADLYALAIIAYEMIAGQLPFPHGHPAATLIAHLMTPPPDPVKIVKDLPRAASAAILRALSKNPDARFKTARQMIEAMEE